MIVMLLYWMIGAKSQIILKCVKQQDSSSPCPTHSHPQSLFPMETTSTLLVFFSGIYHHIDKS